MTAQTNNQWRNQSDVMKFDDAKRIKELEKQSTSLKWLIAEAELEEAERKEPVEVNSLDLHEARVITHLNRAMKFVERMARRQAAISRSARWRPFQDDTQKAPDRL